MHKPPSQKTEFLNSKTTAQTSPHAAHLVHNMGGGGDTYTLIPFSVIGIRTHDARTLPRVTKTRDSKGNHDLHPPLQEISVAYGHTTGNTPEPVRFQKLSLVRPS